MKSLVKLVMKIFYANEKYAKYGYVGMGYFMALMGATFYIMLTGFLILFIFTAIFSCFDNYVLAIVHKLPDLPSGHAWFDIFITTNYGQRRYFEG
jgi:hypothetical protein